MEVVTNYRERLMNYTPIGDLFGTYGNTIIDKDNWQYLRPNVYVATYDFRPKTPKYKVSAPMQPMLVGMPPPQAPSFPSGGLPPPPPPILPRDTFARSSQPIKRQIQERKQEFTPETPAAAGGGVALQSELAQKIQALSRGESILKPTGRDPTQIISSSFTHREPTVSDVYARRSATDKEKQQQQTYYDTPLFQSNTMMRIKPIFQPLIF